MVLLREKLIAYLQSFDQVAAELATPAEELIAPVVGETQVAIVEPVKSGVLYRLVDGLYAINLPMPQVWQRRTSLEQTCLLVGAAWLSWKIYDRREAFGCLRPLVSEIVPGYKLVARWFNQPKIKPQEFVKGMTSLESVRAGSSETPLTPPKFQCQVLEKIRGSDELRVVGCAVRFPEGVIVAPDHVLVDMGADSEKYFCGRNNGKRVSLRGIEIVQLDADLAMMSLTPAQFADIGIQEASVLAVAPMGQSVKIVGGFGRGTSGIIKNDLYAFGKTIYEGTTLPGYSGAAYAAGPQVLAVHQAGGQINAGFSASYVLCRVRNYLNVRFEESADFLQAQFAAGNKVTGRRIGVDEVAININGKFSVVGVDAVVKVFGRNWEEQGSHVPTHKRVDYFDLSPESATASGEAPCSQCPGASSMLENCQDIELSPVQHMYQEFQSLSQTQQKAFRTLTASSLKRPKTTPGPAAPGISTA